MPPLLDVVLEFHNGGYHIFDFCLYSAEELAGVPPVLEDDRTDVVGEADEAAPALVGVELDDEDLRRRQMLDQLNQLIKKEPAEVAQLLRRWMRTEA